MQKSQDVLIFGENKLESLQLILFAWFKRRHLLLMGQGSSAKMIDKFKLIPFLRRYLRSSVLEHQAVLGDYKGLWYEINRQTLDLTTAFYGQELRNNQGLVGYYNRLLNTVKFEAYLKKAISFDIFSLLKGLHLLRLSDFSGKEIIMLKNPVGEFVVKYMRERYGENYRIKWVRPIWGLLCLGIYYGWILREVMRRGFVLNKEKAGYKLSKEAVWGFYNLTLRDDIIIDNHTFGMNDMLMLRFNDNDRTRLKAYDEVKERGFDTVFVPRIKININSKIMGIVYFYIALPLRSCIYLFLNHRLFLFYYIFSFHRQCFPFEMLMNSYRIGCHISVIDHDDIAPTIILNKYGTKNVIFNWSDLVPFKDYNYAFIAHNAYLVWGDIHYDYHSENFFVDDKINIGCIFKKEFNRASKNREEMIAQLDLCAEKKKIITFFDTSFHNASFFTENFFLEYLGAIKEFCDMRRDTLVLLKPKKEDDYAGQMSAVNLARFNKIWKELAACKNFSFLAPRIWGIEKVIAISDVCVNMGMNSPSTIALICGKNALYFDNTGNDDHPFARKYRNFLVFDDKKQLFRQIENILEGRYNCQDTVKDEICSYDAFGDDLAMERMRKYLYQVTCNPN